MEQREKVSLLILGMEMIHLMMMKQSKFKCKKSTQECKEQKKKELTTYKIIMTNKQVTIKNFNKHLPKKQNNSRKKN
jgi:hypothetical protein